MLFPSLERLSTEGLCQELGMWQWLVARTQRADRMAASERVRIVRIEILTYCREDRSMWQQVRALLEMIRFSHTLFALPFALAGAALAWHSRAVQSGVGFRWHELAGILLCMVFARSTAMAFNRLADRQFDAANPRTAQRHLVTGRLSVAVVWLFTLFCSLAFVASTLLFLVASDHPWPLYLAGPV